MPTNEKLLYLLRYVITPIAVSLIVTLGTLMTNRASLVAVSQEASTQQANLASVSDELTQKVASVSTPIGTITAYACPLSDDMRAALKKEGWLVCDGAVVSANEYPQLSRALAKSWGSGNGADTFHLPDLRGVFLRGVLSEADAASAWAKRGYEDRQWINAAPVSQNLVGTYQRDAIIRHKHDLTHVVHARGNEVVAQGKNYGFGWPADPTKENTEGANETRPANAFVYYLIKAK